MFKFWVDDLDNYFNPECYIFVFRHISPKEQSILTVHSTGNLTANVKRAGKPFELAYSHPIYIRNLLKGLKKYAPEGYEVSYEATHHSPTTLKKPVIFVEIGGGEKQWKDNNAINAVAKSVLDLLNYENRENLKICVGLGGSHNAYRFTRRALEENMAFGHIIPAYAFPGVNEESINQAIDKTLPKVNCAVLDKRNQGKAEDRDKILKVFEQRGIEIIKLK